MITDSFDPSTEAIINPCRKPDAPKVDACIITFSDQIERYVKERYKCPVIAELKCVTGITPIYLIRSQGQRFAFYKTYLGAPATVGLIEDTLSELDCQKYILFGGSGCLAKEIAYGKVIVPVAAYRDEGTSYHYVPAADDIRVANADIVAACMQKNGIPYVCGKTWTTDSFYRETRGNFERRKADGCIAVEMECSAVQAMCDFRGLDFYTFFTSGDLLDAPEWDERKTENGSGGQHDPRLFLIALRLAEYVCGVD